jgi:hypothetical protein
MKMGDILSTNTQHRIFVQTLNREKNNKTSVMLKKVHRENVMSRVRFLSCVNGFPKEGDEVEFDSWPGRPTSSSDENVEKNRSSDEELSTSYYQDYCGTEYQERNYND